MGVIMKKSIPVVDVLSHKHMYSTTVAVAVLTAASLLIAPEATYADGSRSFGIEITSDDNLSRSQPTEELSSPGLVGTYSIGNRRQLSDTSSLNSVYQFGAAYYSSYTGYSNVSAEAQFGYLNKTGLGPNALRWGGNANLGYAFYSDGNRSNFYFTGDLSISKRFGDAVDFNAGYAFDTASASNAVYSITGHGPKVVVDFSISDQWLLYGSWKSRTGDSWMTADWSGLGDPGGTDKAPWISDSTFGGAYRAYRKESSGTETKIGANFVLSDKSSIDFGYLKRSIQVTGTTAWYYNNIYSISYVQNL